MLTLNFIGCGRVGQVLGHLWQRNRVLEVRGILNRSMESAERAVNAINGGAAIGSLAELQAADIYAIATADQQIESMAKALAATNLLTEQSCVVHFSGAEGSAVLRDAGISTPVASVHPLRSFGDFQQSVDDFAGTWCGIEGDKVAHDVLSAAFTSIGGKIFSMPPENKLVYHSASVMISNYVNGLADAALDAYQLAGIDQEIARQLIKPILSNTVENILNQGPVDSLTGPIARGDVDIVARELSTLSVLDPELAELYRVMARATLKLARKQGMLGKNQIQQLDNLLAPVSA